MRDILFRLYPSGLEQYPGIPGGLDKHWKMNTITNVSLSKDAFVGILIWVTGFPNANGFAFILWVWNI